MQQLRTTIAMNPKVNQIELRLEKKLEKNVADFASKLQAIQNSADSQELKDKRIKALTDEFKSREFALKKQALKEKRRAETPFLQRVQKRFKLAYNRQHFDFESFAKNVQYQNFSFGKKKIVAEIDNLRLSFSNPVIHNYRFLVIRNTSIKFYEGEIHAVIGESGSGKSVITSALYGLTGNNAIIEEGSIKLFNNEVQDFSFRDWELSNYRGKVISAVFQNPISTLNPTKKVGKQITEGMLINGIVKTKKEAKAKAIEYLKLTKINNPEQVMELYPHELSGGMIQRVVISAILSLEPKIIVMDEPTTALDTTVQALVLDIVRDLQKKLKITIIFITHDLGVVASLATYISIMYAGQVIEEGTRDEILNNPQHPYTWGLILSMPDLNKGSRLSTIRGVVPSSLNEIVGDAFAVRNDYALEQDFYVEPNFYYLSETHRVKSALLDPKAPKVNPPELIAQKQAQWARTHSSNSTNSFKNEGRYGR